MDAFELVAGIALTLALLSLGATVGAFVRLSALKEAARQAARLARAAHREASKGPAADLQARLSAVETRVQSLPDLWEEHERRAETMKNDADKQYARARAARSAAERAARERDSGDEEDFDLFGADEAGGGGEGMPALPGGVGVPPQAGQPDGAVARPDYLDPFVLAGMRAPMVS